MDSTRFNKSYAMPIRVFIFISTILALVFLTQRHIVKTQWI